MQETFINRKFLQVLWQRMSNYSLVYRRQESMHVASARISVHIQNSHNERRTGVFFNSSRNTWAHRTNSSFHSLISDHVYVLHFFMKFLHTCYQGQLQKLERTAIRHDHGPPDPINRTDPSKRNPAQLMIFLGTGQLDLTHNNCRVGYGL